MALNPETHVDDPFWHELPYQMLDGSHASTEAEWERLHRVRGSQPSFAGLRMHVPPEEGRGQIDLVRVSARLWAMLFNVEYDADRAIQVPGDRLIKIRILLSGSIQSSDGTIKIDGAGSYLEAFPGEIASYYVLRGGTPVRLLVLICDPAFFTQEIGLSVGQLPDLFQHVFASEAGAPRATSAALGPELLRAANDVMNATTHFSSDLIVPYLDSKSREIACSVVRELRLAPHSQMELRGFSVRDVSRAHEARDVLLENYQRPPTIPRLARQIGLNQTKLKAMFKAVFGQTINDFTRQRRMDRAIELLTGTNLSVSEIAYAVGYDHPANFTHAFKSLYGHSPRQLRRATMPRPNAGRRKIDPSTSADILTLARSGATKSLSKSE